MAELIANNAQSTLNGDITNVAASLAVANGAVFPATGNFRLVVDSEIMLATARSGNTITVTRAQESTAAASHTSGTLVTHVLTKGGIDTYLAEQVPALIGDLALVTALPGSPSDGDQIILVDSTSAPTYSWHLRYVSAKASNKWVFIGGSWLSAAVATLETTGSTSYAALTTAGPSIALPVAGLYSVNISCESDCSGGGGALMSYDIGGTGAVDADRIGMTAMPNTIGLATFARIRQQSATAVTLTSKYRAVTAGTARFQNRYIAALPIALGG